MIPRGVAVAGIRAAAASQLTAGVAHITLATALPNLARANVVIDGSTQTANVGDTNSALLGTGGTVGDPRALATLAEYKLLPGAAAADAGLNLLSEFGINRGSQDFYGEPFIVGEYDIGAAKS
jgi:hypothetical protein